MGGEGSSVSQQLQLDLSKCLLLHQFHFVLALELGSLRRLDHVPPLEALELVTEDVALGPGTSPEEAAGEVGTDGSSRTTQGLAGSWASVGGRGGGTREPQQLLNKGRTGSALSFRETPLGPKTRRLGLGDQGQPRKKDLLRIPGSNHHHHPASHPGGPRALSPQAIAQPALPGAAVMSPTVPGGHREQGWVSSLGRLLPVFNAAYSCIFPPMGLEVKRSDYIAMAK